MLELAILGLLKDEALHGYELKKRLTETFGHHSRVSFGSLYPALGRLEAAGAVEALDDVRAAPAIPATGSLTGERAALRLRRPLAGRRGRTKRVYRITDQGTALFQELLVADTGSTDDERMFNVKFAFARYLPPDARVSLLERRRRQLNERLSHTRSLLDNGGDRLDSYTAELIHHSTETTERDVSWLDQLIHAERQEAHQS